MKRSLGVAKRREVARAWRTAERPVWGFFGFFWWQVPLPELFPGRSPFAGALEPGADPLAGTLDPEPELGLDPMLGEPPEP